MRARNAFVLEPAAATPWFRRATRARARRTNNWRQSKTTRSVRNRHRYWRSRFKGAIGAGDSHNDTRSPSLAANDLRCRQPLDVVTKLRPSRRTYAHPSRSSITVRSVRAHVGTSTRPGAICAHVGAVLVSGSERPIVDRRDGGRSPDLRKERKSGPVAHAERGFAGRQTGCAGSFARSRTVCAVRDCPACRTAMPANGGAAATRTT